MKKLFLPVMALAIISAPMLSACSVSEEHKSLYTEWTEFSTNAQYSEFFDGNINFSFDIQTEKIVPTSSYHALTYCENIIKLSFQNINQYYGLFQVTPQYNQHQIRPLCFNVKNSIENFKDEVEVFNENKQSFENTVSLFGVNSDAATTELKDFMVYIGQLAVSANNLQVTFTQALSSLYSLPIDRDTAGTSLDVETSVNQIQSRLIDDYVGYSIIKRNMVHQNQITPLYQAIITLDNKLQNNDCLTTSYKTFVESYKLFDAEEKMFKASLNHVNLLQDNANLSGQALLHYQKVNNFVNENASLFVEKTISLLY